mmetsp:Transcript_9781/g.25674  ORF Transcript_9781/g.25674 Transcript_9781/m.25674 type:complete len:229 (+) Transcript_9781:3115-3801(+)
MARHASPAPFVRKASLASVMTSAQPSATASKAEVAVVIARVLWQPGMCTRYTRMAHVAPKTVTAVYCMQDVNKVLRPSVKSSIMKKPVKPTRNIFVFSANGVKHATMAKKELSSTTATASQEFRGTIDGPTSQWASNALMTAMTVPTSPWKLSMQVSSNVVPQLNIANTGALGRSGCTLGPKRSRKDGTIDSDAARHVARETRSPRLLAMDSGILKSPRAAGRQCGKI